MGEFYPGLTLMNLVIYSIKSGPLAQQPVHCSVGHCCQHKTLEDITAAHRTSIVIGKLGGRLVQGPG